MKITHNVCIGDTVKVYQYNNKQAMVIEIYSKKQKHHKDIKVKFDDGEMLDLSYGEFNVINL